MGRNKYMNNHIFQHNSANHHYAQSITLSNIKAPIFLQEVMSTEYVISDEQITFWQKSFGLHLRFIYKCSETGDTYMSMSWVIIGPGNGMAPMQRQTMA